MENGAMRVSVVVGSFVFIADPIAEAGLDWRGAMVAAREPVTGAPSELDPYE